MGPCGGISGLIRRRKVGISFSSFCHVRMQGEEVYLQAKRPSPGDQMSWHLDLGLLSLPALGEEIPIV